MGAMCDVPGDHDRCEVLEVNSSLGRYRLESQEALPGPTVELVFLDKSPGISEFELSPSAREPVFKSRMDQTISFTFRRRPIGLTFRRDETPMAIVSVADGSDGEAAGVHQGMELLSVAGIDITELMYKESYATLTKALESLPEVQVQ